MATPSATQSHQMNATAAIAGAPHNGGEAHSGSFREPTWGKPLSEDDYRSLEACWITRELADTAMLRRVEHLEGREVVGQKGKRNCAGILIPYYWPGEPHLFNYRLRRDQPEWKVGKNGELKPDGKYLGPPNGCNRLYVPPRVTPFQLEDVGLPLVVTEGEKKALALYRLALHDADQLRFLPISVSGVWNWRGTIGKAGGPNGERIDVKGPIPDLARIPLAGRKVTIVFDANVQSNESVKRARACLARELATRGAAVQYVNIPEDAGVNGVDDLLAKWGPDQVLELFEKPTSGMKRDVVQPPQFRSTEDGLIRLVRRGENVTETRLTNFQARIRADVKIDDGVETRSEFEIEAHLLGRSFQFTLGASEFGSMDWAIEKIGSGAIVYPNQREHARTAIQSLSIGKEERQVYAHTGWRKVDGRWLYLHAGGAIGQTGNEMGVSVRLGGALERFHLPDPGDPTDIKAAVIGSLQLLHLGPQPLSYPLLAATYRAVFGDADFALHLVGETGAFKSALAALHQQHFGAGMNRSHLPGAWSSTANSLEAVAFHAKDTLFVLDDFAPHGNAADVGRYHAGADRVFRAVGNQAGRSRLDSTARLRESKPPRALILSTGEDVPRGHSVRARLLILDLAKGAISSNDLTACQQQAEEGLYARCMAAFLRWLASAYGERRKAMMRRAAELRSHFAGVSAHARTPELAANLQAGLETFLVFAEESGAIDSWHREELESKAFGAIAEAAARQGRQQAAAEPVTRYLETLRSLMGSGRAHLAAKEGREPKPFSDSNGWRDEGGTRVPKGECVGWVCGDDVYIDSPTSYRLVQTACRDMGDSLGITEQTLRKRLKERGALASTDVARQTVTVRRKIANTSKEVLHFHRRTIFPDGDDSEGEADA